jgi:hypothetical protein
MNTNLVTIVKRIIAEQGETILDNPRRMKAVFSDLAKDEPKPLRLAFGRCLEAGAYAELKNARDGQERREVKAAIAQRVRDEEGLDLALCNEALDVLEAALFGEVKTPQTSAAAPRPDPPPYREAPPQTESRYQARQPMQAVVQPEPQKKSWLLLAAIILQPFCAVYALQSGWILSQHEVPGEVPATLCTLFVRVAMVLALIFTSKGRQKNDRRQMKIALPLYVPQVLFMFLAFLGKSYYSEFYSYYSDGQFFLAGPSYSLPLEYIRLNPYETLMCFMMSCLTSGIPFILCAIALARARKNSALQP